MCICAHITMLQYYYKYRHYYIVENVGRENIGEFSYLDNLGETLVNGHQFAKLANIFSCE